MYRYAVSTFIFCIQVFFLVVVFGLFHGLAYLPVVLSWIGPDPYCSDFSPKHTKVPLKADIYSKEMKVLSNNGDESQHTTNGIVLENGVRISSTLCLYIRYDRLDYVMTNLFTIGK